MGGRGGDRTGQVTGLAPGETIKSVRKLVNGSPALLDSLQVRSAADRTVLEQELEELMR